MVDIDRGLIIELKHHLALETELFGAGVITSSLPDVPEDAQAMPTITIGTRPSIVLKRKIEKDSSPLRVKGKYIRKWVINPRRLNPNG